jgi:hypothetical protein
MSRRNCFGATGSEKRCPRDCEQQQHARAIRAHLYPAEDPPAEIGGGNSIADHNHHSLPNGKVAWGTDQYQSFVEHREPGANQDQCNSNP